MINKKINSCFFPTKTIFVDDNQEFLDGLELRFSPKNQSYGFYTDTNQALDEINKNIKSFNWYKEYISSLEEEADEKKLLELNIADFYKQIYNKDRFNTITTLVVDYDMPGINGIDFCKAIKNHNIFKIMLTGAGDKDFAVDALSENLIDAYIGKSDPDIYKKLENYIKSGAQSYFDSISNSIFSSLENDEDSVFIRNKDFTDFFFSLLKDKEVLEYYLLESAGSYCLVNKNGSVTVFCLSTDKEIECLVAEIEGINLDNNLLDKLRKKQKMICSSSIRRVLEKPDMAMRECIFDVHPINLSQVQFYYASINLNLPRNFVTFEQFLKTNH